MQMELTGSRSYHVFQVLLDTITEIDHQQQHKCKNYSYKDIVDTDSSVAMVIITIYSTMAHIVLFHNWMFREKKIN